MNKKIIGFFVCMLLITSAVIPIAGNVLEMKTSKSTHSRRILYVGGSGPGNYSTIQSAINSAYPRDTVFVYNDSSPYVENVVVHKSINLIGEDRNSTILQPYYQDWIMAIVYDGFVNVSNFTFQNYNAIMIDGCDNNNIITNVFFNTIYSIFLKNSDKNIVSKNNMNLIRGYGIYLYDAHSNNISDNSISNSTYRGIYMGESNRNNITGNDITLSDDYGIWLGECNSNNISGNIISNNNYGMYLWYSDNNIVSANNIDSNRALGMYLYAFSDSNNISENVISNNDDGIWSFYSNYNIISNNTISSNVEFGTYFYTFNTNNIIEGNTITSSKTGVHIRDASDNNTFYHNIFINNTQNAVDECSNNWDNGTKGNYWDDYPGIDADGDGIGDIPYNISGGNNQDRYPLGFFPPFANFTFAPENPKKHEDIYFYDTSYDPDSTIVSWWWDFDDGFYSDLQNPIHRYIEDGIYNVSLIVSDELGKNDTIIKTIVVYTPNVPPNPPIISGPASGNAGTSYSYTFISADQNGDNVSYYIEWGDGNITNWTAFQASGLPGYSENHTWSSQGAYTIRAKTKDIFDVESEWTILEVTMPKNKATTTNSVIIKNIKNRHVKS